MLIGLVHGQLNECDMITKLTLAICMALQLNIFVRVAARFI